jgi:CRISPR-associated endonuclease/helicase Cas3
MEYHAHTPGEAGVWHDLAGHLQRTAVRARQNGAKFGAGELAGLAGLWHDIGKFNPAFQDYLKDCYEADLAGTKAPRGGSVPHAVYGAMLARGSLQVLSPVIHGHHMGLQKFVDVQKATERPETRQVYKEILPAAREKVEGLGFEGDWRALISGAPDDPRETRLFTELLLRMVFSALVDADFIDTETHFDPKQSVRRGTALRPEQLWEVLKRDQEEIISAADPTPVNEVREDVYRESLRTAEMPRGVFRLAVPTGGGKTRSGLAFALKHAVERDLDRVIVAIPYTSIIEQTAETYREVFKSLDDNAVLEHHSAVRHDSESDRQNDPKESERLVEAQVRARLAAENWDAPLVVTTMVQLFESLFANRTSRCRRLHNLARSVVVLDEVQTLPLGLLKPILSVLRELVRRYGVTVVLCTATQPALDERSPHLEGFEDVTDIVPEETAARHFLSLRRVEYEVLSEEWSWKEVAEHLLEASPERRAMVVLNTRKDALALLTQLEGEPTLHLSTRLCGAHRRDVLEEVRRRLKKEKPCLLVATQVVEAGVDLDFPVVFRALGPLDRIAQAAGRCNREGTLPGKGRVVVFRPAEGTMPPGDEYRSGTDEARMILECGDLDLHDPAVFREYFRLLYGDVSLDAKGIQELRKQFDYPEVANRFRLIDGVSVPVIVRYDGPDQKQNKALDKTIERIRYTGLWAGDHRRLQPYVVSLFEQEFEQNRDWIEEIADGVYVWNGGYDDGLRGIELDEGSLGPSRLVW